MKYLAALLLSLSFVTGAHAALPEKDILALQSAWAHLQYATPDQDARAEGFAQLAQKADAMARRYPGTAEPLIWKGIALASQAQQASGTTALTLAEQSRDTLVESIRLEPSALKGGAYITLGALYYKVPGWPIGFGDADKAREYLAKAVALNPASIDANYFYGDFLLKQHQNQTAVQYLQAAIHAPKQPGDPIADAGRRKDAEAVLARARHANTGRRR